jgi:SNF2 family DNA or RNA helicase
MPSLVPEQIEGARFLANNPRALLADQMGFGKSAQAVVACDEVNAQRILVVTTASARANWLNEFRLWSSRERPMAAWLDTKARDVLPGVTVVAWSNVISPLVFQALAAVEWDVLILDEAHYAKNIEAKRTRVVYDLLAPKAARVWCLTGTPVPNAPNDLYPMCKALFPDALGPYVRYRDFLHRYCQVAPRNINGRRIEVVMGGKNEKELADKLRPFMLRRKTEGLPPIRYGMYALDAEFFPQETDADRRAIIEAAEAGVTRDLDMHLGTLRRLTGTIKAHACVDLVREELNNGLDKIVLFAWHKEVISTLAFELHNLGVVRLDGSTPAADRQAVVDRFQTDPATRVFIGQIQAAGEAITLTAANQVLFVETSFIPKDQQQAVRRVLRRGQTRPCLCRVAALSGSVDEVIQRIVLRKMESIRALTDEE